MITTNVSNRISKNIYNNLNTITNDLYYLKSKTYSKDQIDNKFNKLLNLEQDTNDLYYLKNETYSTQDFSNFINAISNNISNSNSNKIKHNYYYNLNNNITISKKTDTNEKKIVNLISNHNHNNIYFTKSEVSGLINASISNNVNTSINNSVINPVIDFNNKLDTDLFYTKKQTNNINKKINCFLNLQQQNTIKIKNTLQPMITTNVSNRISKNIYNNLNTITNDLYYLKSKTYSKDQIDYKFNKLLNLEQDTNDLYYLKDETYSIQDFSNFINAISNNISNNKVNNKIKRNYYYNLNNNITISKKTDTNEKKIVNLISNHNHNNIYFTKSEVSSLINTSISNNVNNSINNSVINPIIDFNNKLDTDLFYTKKQINDNNKKINCFLNLQQQNTIKIKNTLQPMITTNVNKISKKMCNNLNTITNDLYYLKSKTYSKDQINYKFNKLLNLEQDTNDLYYLKDETYSTQDFSNFINAVSNNISNNKVNNKIKRNYYYNLNNGITISKKTDTNEKKIVNLISNHNHNNIYFTKSEVSSLINTSISNNVNNSINNSVINPIIDFNNKLDTDLFYTKKQINDNNKKINCFLTLQQQNTIKIKNTLQPMITTNVNKISKKMCNNLNTITNDLYYLKSKTYSKDQINYKFNKLLNLEQDTNDLYYLKDETYSIQDFSNFINAISNNISNSNRNKIKHNYYYNLNNGIIISKKTDTNEKKIVNLISNHNHNNIYFTKTEVSSLINASISNVGLNDSVINPIIDFNNKLDTDLFYTKKQTNNINKKINCFLNLQQQNTIKIKNTLQPMITTNVSNRISKNIYNNLNTITNDLYYLKSKTYSKDQINYKFNKLLNLEQDTNDLYYLKDETYSIQDVSNFINAISNNISNSNRNKIKHNYYYNLNNGIIISKKTDTNEKKIVNLISNHNHNNIYFTKTEVSSLINASISNVGFNDSVINPIIDFNNKLDTDLFYTKKQTNNINKKINCFLNLQQQNTIKIKNTLQPMITTNVSNRISKNIYNNLNTITNDLYYLKSKTYSKDQIDNKFNKLLNLEQDTNDLYYLKDETYSIQDFSNFINAISNNISNSNSNKIKHNYYYNLNNNITISKKTDTNEKKIVNLISNHNHNNIYFTKTEVSSLINASINNVNNITSVYTQTQINSILNNYYNTIVNQTSGNLISINGLGNTLSFNYNNLITQLNDKQQTLIPGQGIGILTGLGVNSIISLSLVNESTPDNLTTFGLFDPITYDFNILQGSTTIELSLNAGIISINTQNIYTSSQIDSKLSTTLTNTLENYINSVSIANIDIANNITVSTIGNNLSINYSNLLNNIQPKSYILTNITSYGVPPNAYFTGFPTSIINFNSMSQVTSQNSTFQVLSFTNVLGIATYTVLNTFPNSPCIATITASSGGYQPSTSIVMEVSNVGINSTTNITLSCALSTTYTSYSLTFTSPPATSTSFLFSLSAGGVTTGMTQTNITNYAIYANVPILGSNFISGGDIIYNNNVSLESTISGLGTSLGVINNTINGLGTIYQGIDTTKTLTNLPLNLNICTTYIYPPNDYPITLIYGSATKTNTIISSAPYTYQTLVFPNIGSYCQFSINNTTPNTACVLQLNIMLGNISTTVTVAIYQLGTSLINHYSITTLSNIYFSTINIPFTSPSSTTTSYIVQIGPATTNVSTDIGTIYIANNSCFTGKNACLFSGDINAYFGNTNLGILNVANVGTFGSIVSNGIVNALGSLNVTGGIISDTLTTSGTSIMTGVTNTNGLTSDTLTITGTSVTSSITNSGNISTGNLTVTGTSTLKSINSTGTLTNTGNASISGNINVSGTTTLSTINCGALTSTNLSTTGSNILNNDLIINEGSTPITVGTSITSLNSSISTINTNLTSLNVSPIFCAGYVHMGTSTATCSAYTTYGRGCGFSIAWVQTGVVDITMNSIHPAGVYYIVQLTALSNSSGDYAIVANVNSALTTNQKFRVDIRTVADTITFVQRDFMFIILGV